jgi:hypothetical protein
MKKLFVLVVIVLALSGCDSSESLIQRRYRIKYQATAVGDAIVNYTGDYGVQKLKAFNKSFEYEFENREDVDFFIRFSVNDTTGRGVAIKLLVDGKEKQSKHDLYSANISGSLKELK